MIRKTIVGLSGILLVLIAASIFQPENIYSATGVAYKTVQIVDSLGNVINGVASATTGTAQQTVNVVDSTGHIIDSFGGGGSGSPSGGPGAVQYEVNSTTFGGLSGTGLVKANGASAPTIAAAGTDYEGVIAGNTLAAHNFANSINAAGTIAGAQPAFTDISGNLATTQLNSGTGASGTTFWRGDGTWATPASTGTINAAAQNDVPYFSAVGTATTLSGVAISGLQLDSTGGAPAAYGGTTCTNQVPTALNASGAATCTTLTSAYVNNSIALTGTDINTSNQVTATHITGGTNTDLATFNASGNLVNYAGSGPLASHNFATQISAAGALTGAQPACSDLSNAAASCSTDATNATNISSGTLAAARLPATAMQTGTSGNVFGVGFDFIGTPTASMKEVFTCVYTLNFPASLNTPTSQATCGSNPAETDDYVIKVAGTQKADISLSTSCVATLTAASTFTCTAGQRLEVDAPATVSGADISMTLAYTR